MTAEPVHPLAGKPASESLLVDVSRLVAAYYAERPDPSIPAHRVAFGTSGHRGSSLQSAFNEAHVLAISQAICLYRRAHGIDGPLFLGWDTHALSEPARMSVLEVLAANALEVMVNVHDDVTPTPVISRAIVAFNRGRTAGLADRSATDWIEDRANALLVDQMRGVARIPWERARRAATTHRVDYLDAYVDDLRTVIDVDVLRDSKLRIGVDPLGGASLRYWDAIGARYDLQLTVVNRVVDPTFRFVPVDRDGAIRMDPSSPHVMAQLIEQRDLYDLMIADDPDADRYGIASRRAGLLDANHAFVVAVHYLLQHRPGWPSTAAVGKTVVTSSLIDRVAARLGRRLVQVPVGFRYFVDGLLDGSLGVAGEESAGASFRRRDGSVWITDKDGLIMGLLTVEAMVRLTELAGDQIRSVTTTVGEDRLPIGGIKVVTDDAWFAARPSGTEALVKLYAESFKSEDHLRRIVEEGQALIQAVIAAPTRRAPERAA